MQKTSRDENGGVTRREFLVLTATAALAAGCQSASPAASRAARVVDAGPASSYAADGVYPNFRDAGFFIIRNGGKLFALSSICTHRQCKLEAETNHCFHCPCHGSEFDAAGKVTQGPASRDLPVFAVSTNAQGHLLVSVSAV